MEHELEERPGCLATIWLAIKTGGLLILFLLSLGYYYRFDEDYEASDEERRNTWETEGGENAREHPD